MGLWELAATAARHNAAAEASDGARTRPSSLPDRHGPRDLPGGHRRAAGVARVLPACRRRLTEESPPEPTTWWLIRTSCLVEPPALDAELCSTQGSKRLGSGKKRSKFGEACVALAQYRASRYDEAWKTFTENPLDTPWEAESWSPFNLWAGYAYALAAHGNGLSKDALAQLERADGVYVSICRATLEAGRKELVAGFAGNPWDRPPRVAPPRGLAEDQGPIAPARSLVAPGPGTGLRADRRIAAGGQGVRRRRGRGLQRSRSLDDPGQRV